MFSWEGCSLRPLQFEKQDTLRRLMRFAEILVFSCKLVGIEQEIAKTSKPLK